MKFRDIKNHIKTHPYFIVEGHHRVLSVLPSKLTVFCLDDNETYYWKYKQFFTQHKKDIKMFVTEETFFKKFPELAI